MKSCNKKDIRIVFMGTPDFAVPGLEMLIREGYNVCAVFTQPDRKAGRGHSLMPPPVKVIAERQGIPVFQFDKIRREEGVEALKGANGDLFITIAFGQILTQEILDMPRYGTINVHASLLPKYRGSAPIQWAVINGEKKTGVTTMLTALALDAGDMLESDEFAITDEMTAGELYEELKALGAKTLKRTLCKLCEGTLKKTPQNEGEATYFPMFKKGFGQIDFNKSCAQIKNFVRGTTPAPGAFVIYNGEKLRITRVSAENGVKTAKNGEVLFADSKNGLQIAALDGVITVERFKAPGKAEMSPKDYFRGNKMDCGYVFEVE